MVATDFEEPRWAGVVFVARAHSTQVGVELWCQKWEVVCWYHLDDLLELGQDLSDELFALHPMKS